MTSLRPALHVIRVPAFIYRHQVLRLRHERRIRRGHPPARCLVPRIGLRSFHKFAHARHRRRHDSVPGTRDAPALLRSHEKSIHAGKYKEADDCGPYSSCWPSLAASRSFADAPRQHHSALCARVQAFTSPSSSSDASLQVRNKSTMSEETRAQRKQRLCAPFARGHCRLGARCPDRHSMDTSERYGSACMFNDCGIVSGWPADPECGPVHVRRIPCDCPEKHDACADLPRYVHRCQRFCELPHIRPHAHFTRTLHTHTAPVTHYRGDAASAGISRMRARMKARCSDQPRTFALPFFMSRCPYLRAYSPSRHFKPARYVDPFCIAHAGHSRGKVQRIMSSLTHWAASLHRQKCCLRCALVKSRTGPICRPGWT